MKFPALVFRPRSNALLLLLAVLAFCPAALGQTNPLILTVKATPDAVRPGETVQYIFTASNNGTTALSNVGLSYLVPNNTKVDNFYTPGTKFSDSFGNIPPGQSRSLTGYVTVDAANASTGATAPPDGTVISLTAVSSNSAFSTTAPADVKVAAKPAFSLAVAADEQNVVTPGGTLHYTVRYGNTGVGSGGALLRVPLPANTTLASASDGGSLGADGVIQWNVGALAAGQSGSRRFTVTANASLAAGSVVSTQAEIHDIANAGNSARDSVYTVVRASTLLELTVKASPDAVKPGQTILYTFTATNHGTTALVNVGFTYRVPDHTEVDNFYTPGTKFSDSFGNIPPGQSRSLTGYVTVDAANASTGATAPPDGTVVHLDATATSSDGFGATASTDVVISAQPAFSVAIDSNDSTAAAPGATVNYTVRYGNTGVGSGGALLRVPLPANTTLASASDGGSLGTDGVIQWNVGALAAGQSGVRTLGLAVNASTPTGSVIATQAEIRDAASGISLARSSTVDVVRSPVLLTLSIAAAPNTTVQPGGTINYIFTATNHGTTALANVGLVYRVPANTIVDNFYTPGTKFSDSFGNIPPGQSRSLTGSLDINAANASTGALAPPNGTIVHLDASAASSDGFGADASSDVTVNANTHPAYFTGEVALNNGVYYLSFPNGNYFGYYSYLADQHYIFHFDMGYEYLFDAADGKAGVYLYDFKSSGFFYTSPTFPFPYLYDFSLNSVVYYYPDPSNPGHYNTDGYRFFYVFNTGEIIVK